MYTLTCHASQWPSKAGTDIKWRLYDEGLNYCNSSHIVGMKGNGRIHSKKVIVCTIAVLSAFSVFSKQWSLMEPSACHQIVRACMRGLVVACGDLGACCHSPFKDGIVSSSGKGGLYTWMPWDALGCPECLGQGLAACLSLKFCKKLENNILELYKQKNYAYLISWFLCWVFYFEICLINIK